MTQKGISPTTAVVGTIHPDNGSLVSAENLPCCRYSNHLSHAGWPRRAPAFADFYTCFIDSLRRGII